MFEIIEHSSEDSTSSLKVYFPHKKNLSFQGKTLNIASNMSRNNIQGGNGRERDAEIWSFVCTFMEGRLSTEFKSSRSSWFSICNSHCNWQLGEKAIERRGLLCIHCLPSSTSKHHHHHRLAGFNLIRDFSLLEVKYLISLTFQSDTK